MDKHDLNSGWVHHESDPTAHGLGRQILGEFGADGAGISVGPGHLAPDHAEVVLLAASSRAGSLVLGLEDREKAY